VSALSPKEKSLIESVLKQMQVELKQQLGLAKESTDVVVLDQSSVGRVSRVDALQQQSMALSLQRTAKAKLKRVEVALAELQQSDFGACQKCDEAIGFARLQIQPESKYCLSCQSAADADTKVTARY
jgi:DnaK suppressor protein